MEDEHPGRTIARYREAHDWSQRDVGSQCGRHETTIGNYERGRGNWTRKTVRAIAAVFPPHEERAILAAYGLDEGQEYTMPDRGSPATDGRANAAEALLRYQEVMVKTAEAEREALRDLTAALLSEEKPR